MLIFEIEKPYNIVEFIRDFDISEEVKKLDGDVIITGSQYIKGFVAVTAVRNQIVVFQLMIDTVLFYIENFDDFGISFTSDIIDSMFENQLFYIGVTNIENLKDKMLEYFTREDLQAYETCSYIVNKYNSIKDGKS